jgi:alpha-amylase
MNLRNDTPEQHLVIYFQVHQPRRLRAFPFFDIGANTDYFDDALNDRILKRVAHDCYLPANELLLKLITANPKIKIAFSISGTLLDQLEHSVPEVLRSFRTLAKTGSVEFLAETDYHSLACLVPGDEFEIQVAHHVEKIVKHFGVHPRVLRNTELIYNDDIGRRASHLGFDGVFCEGTEKVLGHRTPHELYRHPEEQVKILLRNYFLSDEISFRYRQGSSTLTVEKFMSLLNSVPPHHPVINIAMDYETFGEHHKKDTGILKFLEGLLKTIAKQKKFRLSLPSEVIHRVETKQTLSVPEYISWADEARDLSAWLGNYMQRDAFDSLVQLRNDLVQMEDISLLETWRQLMTSDHFYYMSTKKDNDGNIHSYFNHYSSPYEAFINYMNTLADFIQRVDKAKKAFDETTHQERENEFERRQESETVPLWAIKYAGSYDHGHLG